MIGHGGRSRTGTGHHAQRVLSPPCLHSNHAATNWCTQRESHPHELALTGFSLRRVYCFATSAKTGLPAVARRTPNKMPACAKATAGSLRARRARRRLEHPQGRAPCSLPYHGSPSLSTGWMQNGRAIRSPGRWRRKGPPSPSLRRASFTSAALRRRMVEAEGLAPS